MATVGMKRQSYTTEEKLRIKQFSEQHGNRAAQREFGIAESNIRLWRKSKENLQQMPRLKCADRGRKAVWPCLKYGTPIVAIFNNLIYIQFSIYIYVIFFYFFNLISIFISYF